MGWRGVPLHGGERFDFALGEALFPFFPLPVRRALGTGDGVALFSQARQSLSGSSMGESSLDIPQPLFGKGVRKRNIGRKIYNTSKFLKISIKDTD